MNVQEKGQSLGLLAHLDPEVRAAYEAQRSEEERRREYAAERLSALYFCTMEAAHCWLDVNDQQAIEQAQRIMKSEAYTDIPVEHTYH